MKLTFDDVLIEPDFSEILSRKDVNLFSKLGSFDLKIPIISSNMDTITGSIMARAMFNYGAIGCMHRFMSIDENVKEFKSLLGSNVICSVGLGDQELDRANKLVETGCKIICIDVAHGASRSVLSQLFNISKQIGVKANIIVGNFGSPKSLKTFLDNCVFMPYAVKIGIGPGSACTTRLKTGCGYPQLDAIKECSKIADSYGVLTIADGGIRTPGDIAKALAAGADFVMLGGMLAGTYETPGETVQQDGIPCNKVSFDTVKAVYKKYRGSASKESYNDQNKKTDWRTAEGESFLIPFKGPVVEILQDIEGGLRSALTYVGASNLSEFRAKAKLIQVSASTKLESGAHGKV